MKKYTCFTIILLLAYMALNGCQKNEGLLEKVQLENLYAIKPQPNNPVQQKRYELYKTYGVPVFFNDTIGRNFIQKNLLGDSIFVYETLDLGWNFTSRNKAGFRYEYITDPEQQLQNLRFVEAFLKETSAPLRPFSILCAKKITSDAKAITLEYTLPDTDGETTSHILSFYSGVRALAFPDAARLGQNEDQAQKIAQLVIKSMIRDKMLNFVSQLEEFFALAKADKDLYDKNWTTLNPKLTPGFDTSLLSDAIAAYYINNYDYTWEMIEEERAAIRQAIGPFGFIYGQKSLPYYSPYDADADLKLFIDEMLRYNRADFEKYWGAYPKVMQKYKILYQFIEKEFQIKL